MRIHSFAEPYASKADVAACREMLRGGSRSFFAASLVLPASVREPATGLYAFCRTADDAVDLGSNGPMVLGELHARLDRIYSGTPGGCAADRAFADVVARFAVPKEFPSALLEGFAWDAEGRRYQNLSQLKSYAVRVAGTVGAMMAMVMGVSDPALLARACELGVAMQLTNIARDVGEDARNGRLYLPLDWLGEAGIDAHEWLARPAPGPALAGVIERVLDAAETLYRRSDVALAQLPMTCRPGMRAARLLYAEIGQEVARRRFDSVTQRAVVPWRRKARILADAMIPPIRSAPYRAEAALTEAGWLFERLPRRDAVVRTPAESPRERARWPRVEDRVVWLIDLFERLERRERTAAQSMD